MNTYARMLLEHHQQTTGSPVLNDHTIRQYTEMGEGIQHSITELRDQILGPQRPSENLHDYQQRSRQALRQAEEIVLAQLTEQATPGTEVRDREDSSAAQDLALINDQLSRLAADWTETAP